MSYSKDMWIEAVERVGDDFVAERLTRDEALAKLVRLGIDLSEALDMLDEAVS